MPLLRDILQKKLLRLSLRKCGVHLNLTPRAANSGKSADPILYRESPHLKIRSNAAGDFKN
jgi:hypothetical protein